MTQEELIKKCLKAPIDGPVTIEGYFSYSADDAIQLGINLTSKDENGNPKFHGISDIRGDEYDEVETEIVKRLMAPAFEYITKLETALTRIATMRTELPNRGDYERGFNNARYACKKIALEAIGKVDV